MIAFWRNGRSGFRRRWIWAIVVFPTVSAAILVTWSFARDWSRYGPSEVATGQGSLTYSGDDLSFRYPSDWKLEVGNWEERGPGHREREIDVSHRSGAIVIAQIQRPPSERPPQSTLELRPTKWFAD